MATRPPPDGDHPARSYPAWPLLAVSTAVIRAGRVLVARRAQGPGAGLFSLPGGLVELGETLAEAAMRELREETGIAAEPVGICGHRDIIARDAQGRVAQHFVILCHAARWTGGEGTPSPEAREIRWATQDELRALPVTEGLGPIVAAAFALVEA